MPEPRANRFRLRARHRSGNDSWNQKTALGFDGGGVRGYWSLLVLKALMKEVERQEKGLDKNIQHSFHPCEIPKDVSHLDDGKFTPFLPCHYFDYIGGTSTGALITIMLSGFRMTVEDCMSEYESMAGKIFGNPRKYNAVWNPFTERPKFSAENLRSAIHDVIRRRAGNGYSISNLSTVLFKTEFGTCRGLVLSMEEVKSGHQPVRIRSYVYNDTASSNDAVMSVDKAARAATAAFLYFESLEVDITSKQHMNMQRMATSARPVGRLTPKASASNITPENTASSSKPVTVTLSDAGFGAYNNPCEEIIRELDEFHDQPSITLVSIGTARPRKMGKGKTVLVDVAKKAVESNGDPEKVHESIEGLAGDRIDYLRLNNPGGLELDMDHWKPSTTGEKTLEEIRSSFEKWTENSVAMEDIRLCAKKLVQLRRERASGGEDRWNGFALGQYYVCSDSGPYCEGEDRKFRARADLQAHLDKHHRLTKKERAAKMTEGTRKWEYRPLHKSDTSD